MTRCEHCQGDKNILKCDVSAYSSDNHQVSVESEVLLCQNCRTQIRLNGLIVVQK